MLIQLSFLLALLSLTGACTRGAKQDSGAPNVPQNVPPTDPTPTTPTIPTGKPTDPTPRKTTEQPQAPDNHSSQHLTAKPSDTTSGTELASSVGAVIKDPSKLELKGDDFIYNGQALSDFGEHVFNKNDFEIMAALVLSQNKSAPLTLRAVFGTKIHTLYHGTSSTNYKKYNKNKSLDKHSPGFTTKSEGTWGTLGGELGVGHYFSSERTGAEGFNAQVIITCSVDAHHLDSFSVLALPKYLHEALIQIKFKDGSVTANSFNSFLNQFNVVINLDEYLRGEPTEFKFNSTQNTVEKFQKYVTCKK